MNDRNKESDGPVGPVGPVPGSEGTFERAEKESQSMDQKNFEPGCVMFELPGKVSYRATISIKKGMPQVSLGVQLKPYGPFSGFHTISLNASHFIGKPKPLNELDCRDADFRIHFPNFSVGFHEVVNVRLSCRQQTKEMFITISPGAKKTEKAPLPNTKSVDAGWKHIQEIAAAKQREDELRVQEEASVAQTQASVAGDTAEIVGLGKKGTPPLDAFLDTTIHFKKWPGHVNVSDHERPEYYIPYKFIFQFGLPGRVIAGVKGAAIHYRLIAIDESQDRKNRQFYCLGQSPSDGVGFAGSVRLPDGAVCKFSLDDNGKPSFLVEGGDYEKRIRPLRPIRTSPSEEYRQEYHDLPSRSDNIWRNIYDSVSESHINSFGFGGSSHYQDDQISHRSDEFERSSGPLQDLIDDGTLTPDIVVTEEIQNYISYINDGGFCIASHRTSHDGAHELEIYSAFSPNGGNRILVFDINRGRYYHVSSPEYGDTFNKCVQFPNGKLYQIMIHGTQIEGFEYIGTMKGGANRKQREEDEGIYQDNKGQRENDTDAPVIIIGENENSFRAGLSVSRDAISSDCCQYWAKVINWGDHTNSLVIGDLLTQRHHLVRRLASGENFAGVVQLPNGDVYRLSASTNGVGFFRKDDRSSNVLQSEEDGESEEVREGGVENLQVNIIESDYHGTHRKLCAPGEDLSYEYHIDYPFPEKIGSPLGSNYYSLRSFTKFCKGDRIRYAWIGIERHEGISSTLHGGIFISHYSGEFEGEVPLSFNPSKEATLKKALVHIRGTEVLRAEVVDDIPAQTPQKESFPEPLQAVGFRPDTIDEYESITCQSPEKDATFTARLFLGMPKGSIESYFIAIISDQVGNYLGQIRGNFDGFYTEHFEHLGKVFTLNGDPHYPEEVSLSCINASPVMPASIRDGRKLCFFEEQNITRVETLREVNLPCSSTFVHLRKYTIRGRARPLHVVSLFEGVSEGVIDAFEHENTNSNTFIRLFDGRVIAVHATASELIVEEIAPERIVQ